MELVNGLREIIPSPYPRTIMLKFCPFVFIIIIINKHVVTGLNPVVISC